MKKEVNIYDLLEEVEKRKAMYLGNEYTFKCLDSFVTGFSLAASPGQMVTGTYPGFDFFSTWLLGHLKVHFGLSAGWYWQIHCRNPGNDAKAFDEFFKFLDVFKQSKISKKSILIDTSAFKHGNTTLASGSIRVKVKAAPEAGAPFKITWTTISNSTTVWLDYFDTGQNLLSGVWKINGREAKDHLKKEFGKLKNKWIAG